MFSIGPLFLVGIGDIVTDKSKVRGFGCGWGYDWEGGGWDLDHTI